MKIRTRGAVLACECLFLFWIPVLVSSVSTRAHSEASGRFSMEPAIQITVVPPAGGGPDRIEAIAGTVSGAKPSQHRVVLFCRTNTWYVQPFADAPYTTIGEGGRWETQTHLGAEYAALLVRPSYKPPSTTAALPPIGGDVLAITRVPAKPPAKQKEASARSEAKRKLRFSGHEWSVKSSRGRVGPGPNHFSDSPDSVRVDAQGRLHLRLTRNEGRWYCAEVVSQKSFGYGTYRFVVETGLDQLDPNVVLGLFTWSDAPSFSHREIDIEISRWGQADNKNCQFVVQPYTHPQNIVRFEVPAGRPGSIHSFTWAPKKVFCQSLNTSPTDPSANGSVIHEHTFTQDIPQPGGENARINLWLLGGRPPANASEVEIIISKFVYSPLR